MSRGQSKKKKKKPKARPKPQVNKEQLKAIVFSVLDEADDDGNGDLDLNESRPFLQKLLKSTYPEMEWDEQKFRNAFHAIDDDNSGSISFKELFEVIYENSFRQGMVEGSTQKKKEKGEKKK